MRSAGGLEFTPEEESQIWVIAADAVDISEFCDDVLLAIDENLVDLAPHAPTRQQTARQAKAINAKARQLLLALTTNQFAASRLPTLGPQLKALIEASENLRALASHEIRVEGPLSREMHLAHLVTLYGYGLRPPLTGPSAAPMEGFISQLAGVWKAHLGNAPGKYEAGPFVELVRLCRNVVKRVGHRNEPSVKAFCKRSNDAFGLWVKNRLISLYGDKPKKKTPLSDVPADERTCVPDAGIIGVAPNGDV